MDIVHHKFVKEIDISILLVQRKLDQNQTNNSSVFFPPKFIVRFLGDIMLVHLKSRTPFCLEGEEPKRGESLLDTEQEV